ncbi:hypothetical protein B1B04_20000 [Lysinibacillus sp. KCTC 33748]|uniref:recombinase family protein n=1 Tax=unclassified Lysinibacillus TaxID=2636778 RepID=UPI0009A7C81C|nr:MULTISPECIES: recombinase family protein [unclassified Lysinibacillus]OXS68581.1 hypothetical protein B1B04_20000 [Lysinibacillus sp. KCTC 33748]SKC08837.1 Site-specific DNA recombinase [Lysinibacillus sp. AC-3]
MAYTNKKLFYNEEMAVYCRVSTAGQNIEQQKTLAKIYFAKNGMATDNVKYYLDNGISANKLISEKRPEFQKLIIEIQKGKVKTLVVQSRDRLARNFYEYVYLVKILYKYDVNVIFSDTNQHPFSNDLSIEAFYGIFAQNEGRNIASKTNVALQQYPNSLWGFDVVKTVREDGKSSKKYIPKLELEKDIRSFFSSIKNVNSIEELIKIFNKFRRVFKKNPLKLLRCLRNPFYAGYFEVQDGYVKLNYVTPFITLNDFKKVQEILLKFEKEMDLTIEETNNRGYLQPICSICKGKMVFRPSEFGESGNYVCSKGHNRNFIEVSKFNQLLSEHFPLVLNNIDIKKLKKDVFSSFLKFEKDYMKQISFRENELKDVNSAIVNLIGVPNKTKKMNVLLKKVRTIKRELEELSENIEKVKESRKGINLFIKSVTDELANKLKNYQKDYLLQLLYSKVEVSPDAIFYYVRFGSYIEMEEKINE